MLYLFFPVCLKAQESSHPENQNSVTPAWIQSHITQDPVNASWIKKNLRKKTPRLFLTPAVEKKIKTDIKSDALFRNYYEDLVDEADEICTQPLLKRQKVGKRLLGVSREALRRITTLAFVYRMGQKQKYLDRLADEIETVSEFSDWDPSHFLDVAEMSMAVAVGVDWAGDALPDPIVKKARAALKKHVLISFDGKDYNWWIEAGHNWNQVCEGGINAAALVLADENPELAARTISRAIQKLPLVLAAYSPDGAYPEGPTYWDYGTSYNAMLLSMYKTALGTDFNLSKAPGFMESALYRMIVVGPSGESFNYSDAGYGSLDLSTRGNLAWFAQKTGNSLFFDHDKVNDLLQKAGNEHKSLSRLAPIHLIWMSEFKDRDSESLPVYWKGEGHNPIAIFRAENDEDTGFYLGVKGGSASVNHGNMDVGSFIFELNGVRWSIDPGTQSYHELEEIMGNNLWDESQNSQRWTLVTKNNRFHSTLTVNGERHNVKGFAPIESFNDAKSPQSVTLNLDEIFKGQLDHESRNFEKINDHTLRITDQLGLLDNTKKITWTMMTTANVTPVSNGAVLRQDGQKLNLSIKAPEDLQVSVISLDPPPLPYDKEIKGLKKIAINIPAYYLKGKNKEIIVELSSTN